MASTRFTTIIQDIMTKAAARVEDSNKKSFAWFKEKAQNTRKETLRQTAAVTTDDISKGGMQKPDDSRVTIGSMLFFRYDPKTKDVLPYYDIFPLIFPIEIYHDGFLGINLHYLDLRNRAALMDALYDLITNKDKVTEKERLNVSYKILKGASKFRNFKPCVKKYLFSHVRSQWSSIPVSQWEIVLFLPLAKFMKASESRVWSDSNRIARS